MGRVLLQSSCCEPSFQVALKAPSQVPCSCGKLCFFPSFSTYPFTYPRIPPSACECLQSGKSFGSAPACFCFVIPPSLAHSAYCANLIFHSVCLGRAET